MSTVNGGRNPPALVMEVPLDNWIVRIGQTGVLGDGYVSLAPEYWGLEGENRLWGLLGAASWQSVQDADGYEIDPMFVPRILMGPGHRPRQGDLCEHLATTLMAYSLAMTEVRRQGPTLPVWEPADAEEDDDRLSQVSLTSTTPSAYGRAMAPGYYDAELAQVMSEWGGLAPEPDDEDLTTMSDSERDLFSDFEDEPVVILLPPPPPRQRVLTSDVPVLYVPLSVTPPPDYTSDAE